MGRFHDHKGGSRAKGGKTVENYGFPMLENLTIFPQLKKKKQKNWPCTYEMHLECHKEN